MASNDMEMEIKLVAATEAVWSELFTLPLITVATVSGSVAEKALESHYFDTQTRRLASAGYAYRIRRTPDGFVATLKAAGHMEGGLAHRPEFEAIVPDLTPDIAVFDGSVAGVDLGGLLGGEPLQLLFTVDVVRRQRQLQITPTTRVEMAVDFGRVLAAGKEMPVAEVEFEMISGSIADLLQFLAELSVRLPFFVAFKSKFRRGVDLLLDVNELEDPADEIVLPQDQPVADAMYSLLAGHIGALLQEQRRLDSNSLSDRAGTQPFRRLLHAVRFWLAFAKPVLKQEDYERYQQLAGKLIEPFDELYQVDALLDDWLEISRQPSPLPGSTWLDKKLAERRQELVQRISADKQSGVYTRALFALWAWAAAHPWLNSEANVMSGYADGRMAKWVADLSQTTDGEVGDPATACRLFQQGQKIMTVLACLEPVVRGVDSKAFIRLQAMQKRLRAIYDAEQGRLVVQSLLRAGASRLLYRDAGVLVGWRLRAVQELLPRVEKQWKRFLKAAHKRSKRAH